MESTKISRIIFWQKPDTKFFIKAAEIPNYARLLDVRFDEVSTPFDLFAESIYMQGCFGSIFHQQLIKSGVERLFSMRRCDSGYPICNILTTPVNARILSPGWQLRRGLQTSSPMTIDGQELIVCDAIVRRQKRCSLGVRLLVEQFFTHFGGTLKGECNNYLAMKRKRDIKNWQQIVQGSTWESLLVSEKMIPKYRSMTRTISFEETCALLRSKYWWKLFLNSENEWVGSVLGYLIKYPEIAPCDGVVILGTGEKAKFFKQIADKLAETIEWNRNIPL